MYINISGAANQIRTGDLYLGKVALYQLSYCRMIEIFLDIIELAIFRQLKITFFNKERIMKLIIKFGFIALLAMSFLLKAHAVIYVNSTDSINGSCHYSVYTIGTCYSPDKNYIFRWTNANGIKKMAGTNQQSFPEGVKFSQVNINGQSGIKLTFKSTENIRLTVASVDSKGKKNIMKNEVKVTCGAK
jgi:hypothetical protein